MVSKKYYSVMKLCSFGWLSPLCSAENEFWRRSFKGGICTMRRVLIFAGKSCGMEKEKKTKDLFVMLPN